VYSFKIIILDEADNLTQDAQSALRRTMEIHSKITRFCLCANYASRIIDPVASRCSKFRFQMLQGEDAEARVKEILKAEGVIDRVLKVADGDLRRAINLLQAAALLVGASAASGSNGHARVQDSLVGEDDDDEAMMDVPAVRKPGNIEVSTIDEISGVIPTPIIENLLKAMRKGPATNYKGIAAQVTDLVAEGYSANETCGSLYTRLMWDEDVGDRKKIGLAQVFSRVDKQLLDGADEHLTMLDAVLACSTILAQK
jgi:DNA polymerase III delta prime subunit